MIAHYIIAKIIKIITLSNYGIMRMYDNHSTILIN